MTTTFEVLVWALTLIIFYRLGRYFTTPLFIRLGWYQYITRMFFIQAMPGEVVELHLGTTYDFFKLKNVNSKILFAHLVDGMHHLCEQIADGRISRTTTLKATTYFLDAQTLHRFGFKTRKLNPLEHFMFALNYLELILLLSLSKGALRRPKMRDVKIAYCQAGDLLAYRDLYLRLHRSTVLSPQHKTRLQVDEGPAAS